MERNIPYPSKFYAIQESPHKCTCFNVNGKYCR